MKHNPLLDELRAAFPPLPIDATGAWEQRGTFYCDAVEYGRQMHGKTWEQLDPQFFSRRSDGLSFLSTAHVVALLPLYLHLLLVFKPTSPVPETLLPMLTRPEPSDATHVTVLTPAEYFDIGRKFFDELTRALSDRQSRVVAATLQEFMAAAPNEAAPARRALDRYWHAFLEEQYRE